MVMNISTTRRGAHRFVRIATNAALLALTIIPAWAQRSGSGDYQLKLASAQYSSDIPQEDLLKAIYVSGFPEFVTWPDETFAGPKAQFTYCVYGDAVFEEALSQVTRAKVVNYARHDGTVDHHSVAVRNVSKNQDLRQCQVLWIGRNQVKKYDAILPMVRRFPVLTVGETDEFLIKGGIISFYLGKFKGNDIVQTGLNFGGAREANLVFSSKLIAIARIVVEEPDPKPPTRVVER
jgi:hypothetical protein